MRLEAGRGSKYLHVQVTNSPGCWSVLSLGEHGESEHRQHSAHGRREVLFNLRYSLGLAANGMWACELGFSLAGLLVGVHLMGAGCVMGNGLGAVVRVSGDRPLVRHLSRRADRGTGVPAATTG
jgi:hypothetical protein